MKSSTLKFYGCLDSVQVFRKKVKSLVKVTCGSIRKFEEYGLTMGEFVVTLTVEQREIVGRIWYEKVDQGTVLRWNDCIGFEDMDPVEEAKNRQCSTAIESALNS